MPQLRDLSITPDMLNKIVELDAFSASWAGQASTLTPAELRGMKRVATIESVGSSNRIEGNRMTDAQVEELFSHLNQQSFQTRDEEEVAGYADLINTIFESYADIPLSENYIKQLHQILLKYSGKDERHRGEYKKESNRVAAFDAAGREIGSIFETAPPFDTPRLMTELVEWTNATLRDKYLHPLITMGIFVVHFLSIHPFTDGNGRLSRALTVLLMLKCNYSYVPYTSMESIIESSKDAYYRALRGTQKTFWSERIDYEPWLVFFLTALQKQKRLLEAKVAALQQGKRDKLSTTCLAILALFGETGGGSLEMADIISRLNTPPATLRKAVQTLVQRGYLKKQGTTKGASYSLANAEPEG